MQMIVFLVILACNILQCYANSDEGGCFIRKKVYQSEENSIVLNFLAQRTVQFLQIDDEVFYVDSPNCRNLRTNESIVCSSEIQNQIEKLTILLPNLDQYNELKTFWAVGGSLEGITFRTYSQPLDIRAADIFLDSSRVIHEHCAVGNEHNLQWRIIENMKRPPLIDCWQNGRRICVCYEHQGEFSACNYTKYRQVSEIIINAQKEENMVDNYVCKINGRTTLSQTIYWEVSDSDTCPLAGNAFAGPLSVNEHSPDIEFDDTPLDAEAMVEQIIEHPYSIETEPDAAPLEAESMVEQLIEHPHSLGAPSMNTDQLNGYETSLERHCNWRLIKRKGKVMTIYDGPCSNMQNMTDFTLPMPESAVSMSKGHFIYHDFDKIRTPKDALIYWIIDTIAYKISSFYCVDDQRIICSSNASENKCNLQMFDDIAVYVHKVERTDAKVESVQCVLNDKYESRKSVTWDYDYFPHNERLHRHH